MSKIVINGIEYTDDVDARFAGCEFCDVRIKDYDYFKEHCLHAYKNGNKPCGKAIYLKRIKYMDYEQIIDAIREKTHKAQGDEHEIYENLAFDSHSSFGYGVRITLYALSQVLGENEVQKAMQNWLNNS